VYIMWSLLSFFEHSDPLREFIFLLLQMENEMDALLAILLLKQPLVECFWVFRNPVKVPSVDTSFRTQNSKSSLHPCAHLHTFLTPSGRVSSPQNVQQFWVLVHLCACSMPIWQSFSESSVILVFLELTTEFLPSAPRACAQCPLGRAPTESSVILSATMFQLHSLTS
jgi:hypothetical protein